MTKVLYALGRFSVRRRLVVLGVWVVVAVALVVVSHQTGDNTNNNLSLPGTGSQQATDTLGEAVPGSVEWIKPDRHPRQERQTDRLQVRERGQQGGRPGREGAVRGFGGQPADPAGRFGAEQESDDGVSVGDARR